MENVVSQDTTVLPEGIKYDTDKPRLGEMFLDFSTAMEALSKVWEFGVKKYGKGNWKYVVNARNRYTNALLRHLAAEAENEWDDETHLLHAAHVAWNALARLFFIINSVDEKAYKEYLEDNNKTEQEITKVKPSMEEKKDILDSLVSETTSDDGFGQLKLDLKFDEGAINDGKKTGKCK